MATRKAHLMVATTATSWRPSRKWIARTIVALGGLATSWATTGSWDQEETVMAITVAVAAAVSYLLPNADS